MKTPGILAALLAALLAGLLTFVNVVFLLTFISMDARISQLSHQVSAARAQLNGSGRDVITCSDLRDFARNIQVDVSGTDPYNNVVEYTGIASSSWLPNHCYNP